MSLYVNITRYADRPVATLFLYRNMLRKCWDSSVSIVSRLRAGRSGFKFRQTQSCLFSPNIHTLSDVHPSSYSRGVGDFFPRGKLGADHCPPHAVEVKNEWSSTRPLTFAACTGTNLPYIFGGQYPRTMNIYSAQYDL